jgi:hypothetical protein
MILHWRARYHYFVLGLDLPYEFGRFVAAVLEQVGLIQDEEKEILIE